MATNAIRMPMPRSKRAAQFAMFDALKGLKEALKAKEWKPEPRRILAEEAIQEIDATLQELKQGQLATVVYYENFEQTYKQLTGSIRKIDSRRGYLQIGDVSVAFEDIAELHP